MSGDRPNVVEVALKLARERDAPKQFGDFRPTHRHRKGGLYQEICRGRLEADLTPVVIYRAEDGTIWVRPEHEFDDGRFTPITPGE